MTGRYTLLVATTGLNRACYTHVVQDVAFLPRVGERLDFGDAVSIEVGAVYHRIGGGGVPLVTATFNHVAVAPDAVPALLTRLGFVHRTERARDVKLATGQYRIADR